MIEEKNIPKHWKLVKLGAAAKFIDYRGKTPKKTSSGTPLITAKNVKMGFINVEPQEYIAEKDYDSWMTRGIPKQGDVLFTTEAPLGNVAQLKIDTKIALAQRIITFQTNDGIVNTFLKYNLMSPQFQRLLNSRGTGTTVKGIKAAILKQLEIPIPPLPEQAAIVAKIEELLSDLENGKQQLLTAQAQLKVYRQSLLKWAFEGKLTNENVKEGELPKGWRWSTFGAVCNKIGDIDHKMPKQLSSGYPYVSTKDFTDDLKISFDNAKYISEEDYLNLSRKIKPERGDIIFPRYGTIGKNILVDFDKDFLVSYSCAVVKPNQSLVLSKYVYMYSLSPKTTEEIRKYTVETTQANVGIASIKNFLFPLPPLEEQQRIVEELESKLTVCDKIEETISQSLLQAKTLRQSILKKAFEGKLV